MTKQEFAVFAEIIGAAYGQDCPVQTKAQAKIWYEMLQDIPIDTATIALKKHIATSHFAPKIADIMKAVSEITEPEQMSSLEAWSIVYKAICNSAYNSKQEFDRLPEACRRAVGSPDNLKEMASMDIKTVQTVEQSHFIRNYDAAVLRIKEERQIPKRVRALISQAMGHQEKLEDYQSKAEPLRIQMEPARYHVDVSELPERLQKILQRHIPNDQICQEA